MGDRIKKCLTILKYGIFAAALLAIFITELLILVRPEPNMETEKYITEIRFPSFFRTHEEQKWFTNMSKRFVFYDRCCQGNTTWKTPSKMRDVTGTEREMAQFKKKKQFFKHDTCIQRQNYCNCKCAVERTMVSGIYVHQTIFKAHRIGIFTADSCCKCF